MPLEKNEFQPIIHKCFSQLQRRTTYTMEHSLRAAEIMERMVAEHLRQGGDFLDFGYLEGKHAGIKGLLRGKEVELAGTLGLAHDIGKVVLIKKHGYEMWKKTPDHLSDGEWKIIRSHPYHSAEFIRKIKSPFSDLVADLAFHHHERWDVKGKEIPLPSRFLTVADALDAMGFDRPYRKKLSLREVKGVLRKESGRQFDPEAVKIMLKLLDKDWKIKAHFKPR
ncbi:MAG: HD domain-containing protein [Candidatus Micrarchaeota archaeon]|nr:HD domain-containing protein [Candidatus Micrarchaeota archaeon]